MMIESDELVIDESNFDQYFFDVRKYKPERGQTMACYTAVAELLDCDLKRDLVYLLSQTDKVHQSITLLRKMGWATEKDAIRVCKEIAEDIVAGMHVNDIAAKTYRYKMQAFYYAKPEYIPKDDPHWSCIEITNLTDKQEKTETVGGGTIKSSVDYPKKEEES